MGAEGLGCQAKSADVGVANPKSNSKGAGGGPSCRLRGKVIGGG